MDLGALTETLFHLAEENIELASRYADESDYEMKNYHKGKAAAYNTAATALKDAMAEEEQE